MKERGLEEGIFIQPSNNLGYFGPEETLMRSAAARLRAQPHGGGPLGHLPHLFEIVEEAFDAPDPKPPTPRELVKKTRPTSR